MQKTNRKKLRLLLNTFFILLSVMEVVHCPLPSVRSGANQPFIEVVVMVIFVDLIHIASLYLARTFQK
jgi:hypothetical protein